MKRLIVALILLSIGSTAYGAGWTGPDWVYIGPGYASGTDWAGPSGNGKEMEVKQSFPETQAGAGYSYNTAIIHYLVSCSTQSMTAVQIDYFLHHRPMASNDTGRVALPVRGSRLLR
jgi:hypothetical protein